LTEENYSHEVNLNNYLKKLWAIKSFTYQYKTDVLKRIKAKGKQAPNSLD